MLKGKHILLGVTGSIAAYKAAMLIRLLIKEGAEVQVLMTDMAKQFITPLTLATLSKRPILTEFYNPENGDWHSHISLGCWADLYLIAPASANTLAKMASGIADNLLLTTYLSARCPVMVAPAMDMDMFAHPSTQENLDTLKRRGVAILEPVAGELASGLDGKGRMEEPEAIISYVKNHFSQRCRFAGKRVLVTAGPTKEAIDPVRYISNHSSGKMGYAIAEAFADEGADVIVVSGPTNITPSGRIAIRDVVSADDMYEATIDECRKGADITVLCAAVSDYTPKLKSDHKIKRTGDTLSLELTPTRDIAAEVGKLKQHGILVGFALETDNELVNAKEKLQKKNLDMIVLNSLNDKGAGFATDTNRITIILKDGSTTQYPLKTKNEVAKDILDHIVKMI